MHLLFVGFVWPEPTSSAAGQNILSYIETAKQYNWQVSFCSAAQTTPQTHDLLKLQVNVFPIQLNCNSFNEKMATLQPDIVIFDRYLSYEQFAWRAKQSCPEALLVLDAEDLHCLRAARHDLLKQRHKGGSTTAFMQSSDITKSVNIPLLHNDIALREIACILQADITMVLSGFEKDLLINHFNVPKNQIALLPFILSQALPSRLRENVSFEHKRDFVFIGNFRHAPNYHAVKILAEQCWPQIYKALHKQHPRVCCHIYGAYMSPKAKQLENKKLGFFVHGFAQDQFAVIKQARVMLAPISFGAGVKGKLLDAMQCSTPSITTPLGIEGITANAWAGEVANTIDEFIAASVLQYTNEEKWQISCQNGYEILDKDYAFEHNSAQFIHTMETKLATINTDRQGNFLQSLLGHHQFQASKYMSQWIEAKNK
ncbi:MAG: glycosyltransferase involved in cell wall biosynthesis [Alphaproteobacteria bacterium]|jgi:glycosyltransferase involved in cell wall biosynthesis